MSKHPTAINRLSSTLKTRWFCYSIITVIGWAGWALLLRIGSMEIPSKSALFIETTGMAPLALILVFSNSVRSSQNKKGIVYSLLNGIVTGGGILFLLGAYRKGGNTSVVAVTTSLYPLVTFALAVTLLREKLSRPQVLGVILATVSVVIFSL